MVIKVILVLFEKYAFSALMYVVSDHSGAPAQPESSIINLLSFPSKTRACFVHLGHHPLH